MSIEISVKSWRESPEAAKLLYHSFPKYSKEAFNRNNSLVIATYNKVFCGCASIYEPRRFYRPWLSYLFVNHGVKDIIDWLVVSPKYRRMGVATTLLNSVHDLVGSHYVWVLMENLAAQKCYYANFYTPIRTLLGDGIWLMR